MEIAFGISHASMWRQYIEYLGNLAHGNLGISITYFPTPVATVIGQDLTWTLALMGTAVVISFVCGTLLGIIVAWRRGSRLDALLPPALTFLSAIPYFWLALIMLYLFGFVLNWFPLSGGYDLALEPGLAPAFLLSAIQHALLPAFTIVVSSIAGWLLGMRNAMMTTLSEDYVLMAQAKGLSEQRVMLAYAARNAILPNITGFARCVGEHHPLLRKPLGLGHQHVVFAEGGHHRIAHAEQPPGDRADDDGKGGQESMLDSTQQESRSQAWLERQVVPATQWESVERQAQEIVHDECEPKVRDGGEEGKGWWQQSIQSRTASPGNDDSQQCTAHKTDNDGSSHERERPG